MAGDHGGSCTPRRSSFLFLDDDAWRNHHHQALRFRGRLPTFLKQSGLMYGSLLRIGTPNSLRPSLNRLMPPQQHRAAVRHADGGVSLATMAQGWATES